MERLIPSDNFRRKFAGQIEEICGERISLCYQCGKCSAGCPTAYAMDYLPNQIIRFAQLGFVQKVLKSSAIWICASCQTCSVRCPRGISLARIMDAVRIIAKREGAVSGGQTAPTFDGLFLGSIEKNNRLHELGLITKLNFALARPFKDASLLPTMLRKGKIKLRPEKGNNRKEVRGIMRKVEELESHK